MEREIKMAAIRHNKELKLSESSRVITAHFNRGLHYIFNITSSDLYFLYLLFVHVVLQLYLSLVWFLLILLIFFSVYYNQVLFKNIIT